MAGAAMALTLTALTPAPACADEPSDSNGARAAELLRAGAAAAKAKQWDACIQAYGAAVTLQDTPVASGELGLCEEQAGRFADAHRHLRAALDAAPLQKKVEPWSRYQAAMTRVAERVAILFVTVTPMNALAVLDGRPVGRADGRYFALEPGEHTIAACLAGYDDAAETLQVAAGEVPSLHLELRRRPLRAPVVTAAPVIVPAKPPGSPASAPAPPVPWYVPGPTPRGAAAIVGYAAGATALVAIASGATAIGLEVDRGSLDRYGRDLECTPSKSSAPVCSALYERSMQRDAALEVSIGTWIGAAALGGLALGLAFGLDRTSSGPKLAPTVSANGVGIVVVGGW